MKPKFSSKLTQDELEALGLLSSNRGSLHTPISEVSTNTPKEGLSDYSNRPVPKEAIDGTENATKLASNKDTVDTSELTLDEAETQAVNDTLIKIESSAMLVEMFDPAINSGQESLHPWQIEVGEELSFAKATSQHPHKFCLCACNGSGKDAYVVAPFAVWFALCKTKSRTIITSASGVQLTAQTENYIRLLAGSINTYFGQPIFKINQRYIYCNLTKSEIRLFATDEEGKAEGYHPIEPGREMCIIVNEAKSVRPEIFKALKRCTGFNYWLNISTPGQPSGDFYFSFNNWPHKRHVTTFDCPHLSASERELDKMEFGEHSALYRSKHLALFTSNDASTIISKELVDLIKKKVEAGSIPIQFQDWPLRIGGDLSAGGDEIVLTGVKGNRITQRVCFRQKDTMVSADLIEFHLINTYKVEKEHEHIYMDDGGVGRGIIDNLRRRGWNIRRILNQSPATNKVEFGNRGAEMWFRCKRILEEFLFRLDDDEKFISQLTNRYYKQQSTQGRITLQSKADARAHGHPSPDRPDSFLLALTGLTIADFTAESKTVYENPSDDPIKYPRPQVTKKLHSQDEVTKWAEEQTYQNFVKREKNGPKKKSVHYSLGALLHRQNN